MTEFVSKIVDSCKAGWAESINQSINLKDSKIVLCHGVFDVVHPGHIEHFIQSRELGDFLVVSLTADEFVNKGPGRPIFDLYTRAKFISMLSVVDFVVLSYSESAVQIINELKPHIYVKGQDYKQLEDDDSGKILLEKQAIESIGGSIKFTGGFTSSSTSIINSVDTFRDSQVQKWLKDFREKLDYSTALEWLNKIESVRPLILGEFILDRYTHCRALSKSSKDPILAFEKLETDNFIGGAAAVAHNISSWTQAELVIVHGYQTTDERDFIESRMNESLTIHWVYQSNYRTIIKHRFVDESSGNKIFELYDYVPKDIDKETLNHIKIKIEENRSRGPVIITDYGHGFFTEDLIEYLVNSNSFLGINTQTNAGNRGFNAISKYNRGNFIALNGGELELEYRKKNLDYLSLVPYKMKKQCAQNAIVTLGKEGMLVFSNSGTFVKVPALAAKVVDKVGAGDAVHAMGSLLSFLGAPIEVIGLFASIVAANEVSQLGHRESMSKIDLRRSLKGLLS